MLAHQGYVQSLVAVGFGVVEPVAQTVGMAFIDAADGHIDVETFVDFFATHFGFEDNSDGENIIDFFERYVLVLHLIPYRIRTFYARFNRVFQPHLV